MRNWIYYRGNEYRFHPSYGWVKRESNESFDEAINKLKTKINNENMETIKLNNDISSTAFDRFSETIIEKLDLILTDNFGEFNKVIDEDIDNQIKNLKRFFLNKLTELLKLDLNTRLEYNDCLSIIIDDYLISLKRDGSYIRNN